MNPLTAFIKNLEPIRTSLLTDLEADLPDLFHKAIKRNRKRDGSPYKSKPRHADSLGTEEERWSYYVWRMERFYTGVDTQMPVMALWGCVPKEHEKRASLALELRLKTQAGNDRWASALYGGSRTVELYLGTLLQAAELLGRKDAVATAIKAEVEKLKATA